MKKELRLTIDNLGKWSPAGVADDTFGFENENQAVTLRIDLPTYALSSQHFIEFLKPSGESVSSGSLSELDDQGSKYIEYKLGSALLDEKGRYHIQYVGRKTSAPEMSFKSELKAFDVKRSINAGVEIVDADPDFITWATNEIAALRTAISVLPDMDEAIENLSTRLTRLEILISETIYMGVIFYGSETVGDRLGAAYGLRAGINGAPNDFDSMPIYRDIRTYLNEQNEKIWECSKSFYYKHVVNGVPGDEDFFEAHYISLAKLDNSWGLHVAFLDKDKNDRGKFTLGAYKATANSGNSKLLSLSGAFPKTNISLETARVMAAANNAHIAEMRKADAINILIMIEFASRDLQRELLMGVVTTVWVYGGDYQTIQESIPANIVRYPLADVMGSALIDNDLTKLREIFAVGAKIRIYDDNEGVPIDEPLRAITAFEIKEINDPSEEGETLEIVEITYDGSPVLWENADLYPALFPFDDTTGQCDDLLGSTNENTSAPIGLRHFAWRGLEDWWGEFYELTDGECLKILVSNISANRKTNYGICFDPTFYSESNYDNDADHAFAHYETVAELTHNGGCLQAFKELPNFPGLLVPNAASGNDSTYYADYNNISYYGASGDPSKLISRIFYRGGDCGSGFGAGPFFVGCDASTGFSGNLGVRLSYDPS